LKAVSSDGVQVDCWDVGRAATIERRAFEKRSIVDLCPVALGYGPGGAFEQGRSARQLVVLGEGQSINRIFAAARSPPPLNHGLAPDSLVDLRTGERVLSVVDARGPPSLTAAEWPLTFAGDREIVESSSPLGERIVSPVNARATSCCSSPDGAWVATCVEINQNVGCTMTRRADSVER